jgi:serine protease Do
MQLPAIRWAGLGAALLLLGLAGAPRVTAAQEGVAWLGVYTQTLSESLREGLDYRGDGIAVTRVVDDSPAERAGVRKGDIIVSLNDRTINSSTELMNEVRAARTGQRVALEIFRDGARRTLSVTLGTRPDDDDFEVRGPEPPEPPEPPLAPRAERRGVDLSDAPWMFSTMGRGRLGVRVETVSADLGEALGTPSGGALIIEVLDDTPAERAGLKAGDVIVRLEDVRIDDAGELTDALRERDAGPVAITVSRRGSSRTLTATLQERHAYRWDGPMTWRSAPGARSKARIEADSQKELQDEIRQLRDEVKKLQEQMESRERN